MHKIFGLKQETWKEPVPDKLKRFKTHSFAQSQMFEQH